MKLYTPSLFTLLFLFGAGLTAQDAPVVVLEEEEEAPKSFRLSGYVDAYYQANFANSAGEDATPLVFGSSFTDFPNTFGIGNVNLLAEKSFGKVSFVGQIGFGPRAVAANSDSNLDEAGTNFASTVQQLYVTYSPTEAVTFTLGNFGTFIGYEVIDAPANMNYSMSYLFSNGPFYHTGAKVDFALAEGFGAMIGVFNDTDSKFDAIAGKHIGGQLSAEAGGLAAYLNAIYGKEQEDFLDDGVGDLNELQVDLTATLDVNESLMLGINASSYSTSFEGAGQGGFFGTALYATVAATETFDFSLRGEYFGLTAAEGVDTEQPSVLALTASGNFTVGELRIVPELRFDTGSNGFTFGEEASDDSAFAFILAGVYAF
ncbi:outer membrane beta-barrel protein [Neolewinella litorea]|uniref:Porin n=1 Tax=Neolewinella litorea TaxID=2562452 RepID=A0A4S4N779_9BACT|nr:outer membrane beta-barrel protein [Neolewinella litorea]THH35016.1 porin [Neolewinella litorea]